MSTGLTGPTVQAREREITSNKEATHIVAVFSRADRSVHTSVYIRLYLRFWQRLWLAGWQAGFPFSLLCLPPLQNLGYKYMGCAFFAQSHRPVTLLFAA